MLMLKPTLMYVNHYCSTLHFHYKKERLYVNLGTNCDPTPANGALCGKIFSKNSQKLKYA